MFSATKSKSHMSAISSGTVRPENPAVTKLKLLGNYQRDKQSVDMLPVLYSRRCAGIWNNTFQRLCSLAYDGRWRIPILLLSFTYLFDLPIIEVEIEIQVT